MLLLGSAALAFTLQGKDLVEDSPRTVKPAVVWSGVASKRTSESVRLCRSDRDWKTTWIKHQGSKDGGGDRDRPEIDFGSYMVLALLLDTSRVRIVEVLEEVDRTRVRYARWGNSIVFVPRNQDGCYTVRVFELGRGEIEPGKPYPPCYAFVLLPRSDRAVVVEEEVRRVSGEPPEWKVREILGAAGTKR